MKKNLVLFCLMAIGVWSQGTASAATPRETVAEAVLASTDEERLAKIKSVVGEGDPALTDLLGAWKGDKLFIFLSADGSKIPVTVGEKSADGTREATVISTGKALTDAAGAQIRPAPESLTVVEHNRKLRVAMKEVLDLIDLGSPDLQKRIRAIQTLGFAQDAAKLDVLKARQSKETNATAKRAIEESIALIQLKDPSDETKLEGVNTLKELHSLATVDRLKAVQTEAEAAGNFKLVDATKNALIAVEKHRDFVDFFGTLFRGLSSGSILLVAAIGLAITFGLMGVINMAHGEMIAVGAYTTYVIQNVFGTGLALSPFGMSISLPGLGATGSLYSMYFLVAIPCSFLMAALVGIVLERSVIQFLYRRPLESLLATWGVSLVLQQLFRLTFGANNVQVSSPVYLSGNWTVNDIIFGWNRIFVIGFAVVIVWGTHLILTKTPLGLLIRSVMQNRSMAACMGVRTERVNMLTFGLGSGLAGLAGAFLSQITNVGPSLGQNYIVDTFMTVVVGGVGSLFGTVFSALGIGMTDQALQQILGNPVIGKIMVLIGIILFLQWKPAGLFVTRSRSLED